jgi:hypothetical protein
MEAVLTFGLLSLILDTASGAQNLGVIGALGVGGYIGPDLVGADFTCCAGCAVHRGPGDQA